jgi:nucleoside-diphosphate-sugar epimerase
MKHVLVTGATGLLGANVCQLLRDDGDEVTALVRSNDGNDELAALGVTFALGDVTDIESVRTAASGCSTIIHTAGLLGGAGQELSSQLAVNQVGSSNIFDVGAQMRLRVVHVSSLAVFNPSSTITETTDLDMVPQDPYTRAKRAAHAEALERAKRGQDVVVVVPGSFYGPSPCFKRALSPTSYNRLLRGVINGRVATYPGTSTIWVFAEDVARIAVRAAQRGESGETYLAAGEDGSVLAPDFLNLACELAGVEHRVQVQEIDTSSPDAVAQYGASIINNLTRPRANPAVDATWTQDRLDVTTVSARVGLAETVEWLIRNGQVRTEKSTS